MNTPARATAGRMRIMLKSVGQAASVDIVVVGQPWQAGALKVGSRNHKGKIVLVPSMIFVTAEFSYYMLSNTLERGFIVSHSNT